MESVSGSSEEVSVAVTNRPTENEEVPDPPYISYLLNPTTRHTFFFLVGDPSLEEQVEKIGAMKLALQAHSKPFRSMLEESELAEKGLVQITDIQPNTFRHLLRFMYGYNNVPTLTMEEAVDLVYAVEKYLVGELKDWLAAHISSILTVDNVFRALQKPECFQWEELADAILKIVQYETKSLVSKDEFLTLNDFGVQIILEQNGLGIPEIDVWRAMLKWAKHNALSGEALELRGKLERHLKYIRFCTLRLEDLAKEVVVTGILTKHELYCIIHAVGSNTKQEDLTTVCNEIEARNLLNSFIESPRSIKFPCDNNSVKQMQSSLMFIITKDCPLLLTSALCWSNIHQWECTNKCLQYKCQCKISITKITDCANLTSDEPPLEFVFEKFVEYHTRFRIPFRVAGKNVKLLPNNLYKIKLDFSPSTYFFWNASPNTKYENEDLTVVLGNFKENLHEYSGTHIDKLAYKTIKNKI